MTPSIDRSVAVLVLVAFVCIAGVGMSAATLNTAEPVGSSDNDQVLDPPDPRDEVGSGDSRADTDGASASESAGNTYQSLTTCVGFLDSTLGTLTILGAVLGLSLLIYYRFNGALALFTGWTIFPPIMLAYFMLTDCSGGAGIAVGNSASGGFAAGGEGIVTVTDIPSWVLIALVSTVLAGAVAVLYRTTGGDETAIPTDDNDDPDVGLDRLAEAAGRAADRIEEHNEDVDNSVYRAWIEMTDLLDVDKPETYSAGEFEEAAVALGMDEEDVSELTHLFNEVRYGGKDAAAREERAVSILRNIETRYVDTTDSDARNDDSHEPPTDERADEKGEGQ